MQRHSELLHHPDAHRNPDCNSKSYIKTDFTPTTTLAATPRAPTNLTATAVSLSQINLSWTDNSNNETGFKVERSTDGTTFTQIATVGANVTMYVNTTLPFD